MFLHDKVFNALVRRSKLWRNLYRVLRSLGISIFTSLTVPLGLFRGPSCRLQTKLKFIFVLKATAIHDTIHQTCVLFPIFAPRFVAAVHMRM